MESIITLQGLMAYHQSNFFEDGCKIKMMRLQEPSQRERYKNSKAQDKVADIWNGWDAHGCRNLHELYAYPDDTMKEHSLFQKYISEWCKTEENRKNIDEITAVQYLVAMLPEEGTNARLAGVYKVHGEDHSYNDDYWHIKLELVEGEFASLYGRVIISMGDDPQSARRMLQWLDKSHKQFEVIGIDEGVPPLPFVTYEQVRLSLSQMRSIIARSNSLWRSKLSAVNGIYAIIDDETGRMYIGSTYSQKENDGGIWNRWNTYAATGGHGNNEELLKIDKEYIQKNFHWVILETLPLNIKADKAVERENFYKEKFGTRKHGYNLN